MKRKKNIDILKMFSMVFLVICCAFSCGCSDLISFYADLKKQEESEAMNYESGSSDVTNSLGETYTVKYAETDGFPSHRMYVKIYRSGLLISDFRVEFEHHNIPNQIMYLFNDSGKDYYYAAAYYKFIDAYNESSESLWDFIIIVEDNGNSRIDLNPTSTSSRSLSKTLHSNLERDYLINRFNECGYDSKNILSVYDL